MKEDKMRVGVRLSKIFFVLGTKNYFDDPPKDLVEYAKSLNKPFRVLLWEGVEPYEGFRDGVEDYKEVRCNDSNYKDRSLMILEDLIDKSKANDQTKF